MRQLLEALLDGGMSGARAAQFILPVILAIAATTQLISPHAKPGLMTLRRLCTWTMILVLVVTIGYCLLALLEAQAFDKSYFFGVLLFPGVMLWSIVISIVGLLLHHRRR